MKRGQVTIFIAIGVVLVAVIILLFLLYQRGTRIGIVEIPVDQVKRIIENCIQEEAGKALILLGNQGGDFNPSRYQAYKDQKLAYLCYNDPDSKSCINRFLTLTKMENDLNIYMKNQLEQCISLEHVTKGYDLDYGEMIVETNIGLDNVIINLNFPIEIKKGGYSATLNDFSDIINLPLGRLFTVAQTIVNARASPVPFFDAVGFQLQNKGLYEIQVDRPYPNEVYIINIRGSDYKFQFAIEDEE